MIKINNVYYKESDLAKVKAVTIYPATEAGQTADVRFEYASGKEDWRDVEMALATEAIFKEYCPNATIEVKNC